MAALKQRQTTTRHGHLGLLAVSYLRTDQHCGCSCDGWPVETATNTGSGAVPRPRQHSGVQNCSDGLLAGEGD
jgi:hypothetical protein